MTVAPDDFVSEMEALWSTKLGNHSSASFRSLWHKMATTYLDAITANKAHNPLQTGDRSGW